MTKGDFTKCASVWHILRPEISPTHQVVSDVDRNRRFSLRRLRRIGSCRISIKMTVFQAKNGHFSMFLPFFPTARLCFCVARILPLILFSYHSFLRFSVNFLSHSHFVKFDIKISQKRVLFLILSHNLSHKPPFCPCYCS